MPVGGWLESYKAEVYDDLIPQILDRVQLGSVTLTQVMGGLVAYPDTTFAVARISRERQIAAAPAEGFLAMARCPDLSPAPPTIPAYEIV